MARTVSTSAVLLTHVKTTVFASFSTARSNAHVNLDSQEICARCHVPQVCFTAYLYCHSVFRFIGLPEVLSCLKNSLIREEYLENLLQCWFIASYVNWLPCWILAFGSPLFEKCNPEPRHVLVEVVPYLTEFPYRRTYRCRYIAVDISWEGQTRAIAVPYMKGASL